jgi:alkylresorcinol/alkylpyrone synthase
MPPPSPPAATPRLIALTTAVPPHDLDQTEAATRATTLFATSLGGIHRLAPVYRNAQIEHRQTCERLDWYFEDHAFSERNALFLRHGVELLVEAAETALAQAGLAASDIDAIVTVSSSGVATPALDARVMRRLAFRPDVERLPIVGLGCAGGVMGLSRAAAMARAAPAARVLLLVVELCSLTFRKDDRSKSNMVATALFGDGAAAAILTCDASEADPAAPRLRLWGEHTWPESLDVMGWEVAEDGLKVMFSRDIPTLVRNDLRPVADAFLGRHGMTVADIDHFVCHPGGAKVVDALEQCFDLAPGALADARDVLRAHGNMSAATVLFVLRAALDGGVRGRCLLTTLGPGFTAAMMTMDVG